MARISFLILVLFISAYSVHAQLSISSEPDVQTQSFYVPAVNGTKLAIDVHFPLGYEEEKLPVLFEFTRYWRSSEDPTSGKPNPALGRRDKYFLDNDYILAKVDVRGTGASYGQRPGEYSPIEVQDAKYVVEWVVNQSWSNGVVGAYGTSYSGTTAELLCATQHEAIKAVIPGWSDFDVYESPVRPYGMLATSFIAMWSQYVHMLDQNDSENLRASIRRVSDEVPSDAIAEHKDNPNVLEGTQNAPYKDSKFGDFTYFESSPIYWAEQISQSRVPMLVLTSWMDAGTAEGTLLRFKHFKNPQKLVLMPTSHGGGSHASPYIVSDSKLPPVPSVQSQLKMQLDFFDYHLKGKENDVKEWPNIQYYNLGEEAFKTSEVWPPKGQVRSKFYLTNQNRLQLAPPASSEGQDRYPVDYSVSTGRHTRWTTQMGQDVLNLHDRSEQDKLMQTYTSEPLTSDMQISGTPYITLHLSSTHDEGALFVYLEDVAPDGTSTYLTEGGLNLKHRKLTSNPMNEDIPFHSFNMEDASPMPKNKVEEISFKLWPISVLLKEGHSVRIAIAGADKGTFDRVPAEGNPVFTIYRNNSQISFIDLPVIE